MLQLMCIIVAVAAAAVDANSGQVVANRYVDALLQGFPEFARQTNLDPLDLPEDSFGFSKKLLLVTWHGGVSYQGHVTGLSTLHRSGDFITGYEGTRGFIDGTSLTLNNMQANFRGRAHFQRIAVHIGISARISKLQLRFRVSSEVSSGAVANLDSFNIHHISSIDISVNGLGLLSWILDKILSRVATSLRGKIGRAIEGPVRNLLAAQVRKIRFPKF